MARQLNGKELSYNNVVDAEAAYALVMEFESPACVIIKHTNPCGVATGKDLSDAYCRALMPIRFPLLAALSPSIARLMSKPPNRRPSPLWRL